MKYLLGRRGMELTFEEKEIPKPGYQEALIKVSACGVCGSDLHLLSNSPDWTPLGHEISGEVVELGPEATKVKLGDKVIVEDLTGCGKCKNCKNGRFRLCTDMLGLNGQSGMGEYLCVNEKLLDPYDGLSPVIASLTEPLAVCINTYLTAEVPLEGNVVILGLGPLAVMTAALARHFGAGRITCVGSRRGTLRNQARESAAKAFGVDQVCYMSDDRWKEQIKQGDEAPIHSIIVTSPPKTLGEAMELADYGTKIIPIGLDMGGHSTATIDVDHMIMNKNPILPFIAEPAKGFPLSIDLLKKKVIGGEAVVTHRISFENAEQLKEIFTHDNGVIKAVITMD